MVSEPIDGQDGDVLSRALRALDEQVAASGEEHVDVAHRCLDVAFRLAELGRHDSSLQYRRRALAVRERVLGERHPDTVLAMNHVGHSLVELGRAEEARTVHARALEILEEVGDAEGATLARAHYSLAAPLVQLGRHDQARHHLRTAHDLARRTLGPLHALTLDARRMLKVVERAAGTRALPRSKKTRRRRKRRK